MGKQSMALSSTVIIKKTSKTSFEVTGIDAVKPFTSLEKALRFVIDNSTDGIPCIEIIFTPDMHVCFSTNHKS